MKIQNTLAVRYLITLLTEEACTNRVLFEMLIVAQLLKTIIKGPLPCLLVLISSLTYLFHTLSSYFAKINFNA